VTASAPASLLPSECNGRRTIIQAQECTMPVITKITLLLLIVGGLNWGLVGLLDFDLVAALFGEMSMLSRIVYTLVGASALWQLIPLFGGGEEVRKGVARG
jgi:uncharacterized membrane protein YuzA (DUF378 family)